MVKAAILGGDASPELPGFVLGARVAGGAMVSVVIVFHAAPVAGFQRAYFGTASIEEGSKRWEAGRSPHGVDTLGTFSLTLSSVTPSPPTRAGGTFEVHGTITIRLLPAVDGTGAGVVDVAATF